MKPIKIISPIVRPRISNISVNRPGTGIAAGFTRFALFTFTDDSVIRWLTINSSIRGEALGDIAFMGLVMNSQSETLGVGNVATGIEGMIHFEQLPFSSISVPVLVNNAFVLDMQNTKAPAGSNLGIYVVGTVTSWLTMSVGIAFNNIREWTVDN